MMLRPLQILSQTKNPLAVQPHLRKCFEAIESLDFQPDLQITAMNSKEKEKVGVLSASAPCCVHSCVLLSVVYMQQSVTQLVLVIQERGTAQLPFLLH